LRRLANDVELGPCNLAHSATSQSTFDANGAYGFEREGFPSEAPYTLCDGDVEPMGSPARVPGNLTTLGGAQVRWRMSSGGTGVRGLSGSISLGGSDPISGPGVTGGSQPGVVSLVKKSASSSLLSVSLVTGEPGDGDIGPGGTSIGVVKVGEVWGEKWRGAGK